MLIVATTNPQRCSPAVEMGLAVTMAQAKALLAQRRPMAKVLPKIVVRRKR
jgi:hypothetical protein